MFFYILQLFSLNLIYLPKGSIKHPNQIKSIYKNLKKEFKIQEVMNEDEILQYCSNINIYILKSDNQNIGFLFIDLKNYYDCNENLKTNTKKSNIKNKIISRKIIEIYSFFIDEKYRRQGYGRKFLKESVKDFRQRNNLNINECLLGLHLNCYDQMMDISYKFYTSLNFKYVSFVKHGPNDFKLKLSSIFDLYSSIEFLDKFQKMKDKTRFVAMFVPLKDFKDVEIENKDIFIKNAKKLKTYLMKINKKI